MQNVLCEFVRRGFGIVGIVWLEYLWSELYVNWAEGLSFMLWPLTFASLSHMECSALDSATNSKNNEKLILNFQMKIKKKRTNGFLSRRNNKSRKSNKNINIPNKINNNIIVITDHWFVLVPLHKVHVIANQFFHYIECCAFIRTTGKANGQLGKWTAPIKENAKIGEK